MACEVNLPHSDRLCSNAAVYAFSTDLCDVSPRHRTIFGSYFARAGSGGMANTAACAMQLLRACVRNCLTLPLQGCIGWVLALLAS